MIIFVQCPPTTPNSSSPAPAGGETNTPATDPQADSVVQQEEIIDITEDDDNTPSTDGQGASADDISDNTAGNSSTMEEQVAASNEPEPA
jgi:hypothetical protein